MQQVEHDAGIERAATRSHHQAIQRRKAHGGGAAATFDSRAQTGAVAQMRHQHATRGQRTALLQHTHHVLVRQAMKAIAPHPLRRQPGRQGKVVVHRVQCGVKSGVKAGDLRYRRKSLLKRSDALQVLRLVQRRQRVELRELRHDLVGDQHTGTEVLAAVHHAVRNRL